MSYFLLPKINNIINVNPILNEKYISNQYVSNSLYNYYNEIYNQIISYIDLSDSTDISYNTFEELTKIVNPYEYIFSKVPSSKFSVSKLKPVTNLFYEFLEICTSLAIFDEYKSKKINTLYFSPNSYDTIECFEMIRENYSDKITHFDEINNENIELICDDKFNFLFFETKNENTDDYIISLIKTLMIIYRNQEQCGTCIIKINTLFNKVTTDFVYILSSLFDKTYILKPNASNIATYDKYIVCKNYNVNENKSKQYKLNYFRLSVFLNKIEEKKVYSLLDFDIPYYFLTKIDDINIIIGQQQIESLDLIINILKNKNKEEKIETIKKTSIQKSVSWCEKYKIPCNKFSEKTNIFLPIT